jgi:TolB-like protein
MKGLLMKHKMFVTGIFSLTLVFVMAGGLSAQTTSIDEAIKGAADDLGKNLPKGSKIAVLNFTGGSDRLSTYVIEELNSAVVNGRLITAVDRAQLDLVRQEMNFQMSGEVSDESAQEIGKMLGAQYIVSGSIDNIGNVYRFRVKAIEVMSASIQISYSANVQNDEILATLMGTGTPTPSPVVTTNPPPSPVVPSNPPPAQGVTPTPQVIDPNAYQDFTTGRRIGAGFLNLAFGAGSFIMGDWVGGLLVGGAELLGIILMSSDMPSYESSYDGYGSYSEENSGGGGGYYAGVALMLGGAIYGYIRPFQYHRPRPKVVMFNDSTGLDITFPVDQKGRFNQVQVLFSVNF